jgi:hypothetical protein
MMVTELEKRHRIGKKTWRIFLDHSWFPLDNENMAVGVMDGLALPAPSGLVRANAVAGVVGIFLADRYPTIEPKPVHLADYGIT